MRTKSQRHKKLGLVLSGGGARGAFQVGVYEQLLRDRRFADGPSVLSGTSAGAINSALIAAGKTPREMMDFWNAICDDPPVVVSPVFFDSALRSLVRLGIEEVGQLLTHGSLWLSILQRIRNHVPPQRGGLVALAVEYVLAVRFELLSKFMEGIREPFLADTGQLRDRLIDVFGGEEVPTNGTCLAINTVDAHTGSVVRFVNVATPFMHTPDYVVVDAITVDMVLASASIPLLFPPVQIGRHLLWDGGLLVNTPLAPVVSMGAEEIITVLVTEPPDSINHPLPHFGRAVERTVDSLLENAYNVDRKLLLERNRLARIKGGTYRDVTLYEAVRPARDRAFNAGSYLYFERNMLDKMYRAGKRAGHDWLAAGPVVDHLEEQATAAA